MMLLGDNYMVESDRHNVTLYHKTEQATGGERWRPLRFYSTLKEALDAFVDLEVMEAGLEDFRKVAAKQEELHKLIASLPV